MKDICFYCQKEMIVEEFQNPYTYEAHPTCERCKSEMSSYVRERKFFAKSFLGVPLLLFFSIISFIFVDWKTGILFIAMAIVTGIISYFGLEYFCKKRDKKLGTYVDVKSIQWCKTCKHFKKVKSYGKTIDGLWRSEQMIKDSEIPCKVLQKTQAVWMGYFNMKPSQRTLYPKNCKEWAQK
jgi:hypothetical protein